MRAFLAGALLPVAFVLSVGTVVNWFAGHVDVWQIQGFISTWVWVAVAWLWEWGD